MNIALIKNNTVQNIAVFADLQTALDMLPALGMDEAVEADGSCGIGYTYKNGVFAAPVPVPSEVEILRAQVQALSGQNDFLEECIAEMAMILYS